MKEQLKREQLLEELEQVRALSEDGLLHPAKAVAWARQHPNSVLHGQLEWNDTTAGEQFRVQQVRQIIRIVVIPSAEASKNVRAYVSLPSDRAHDGGYRRMQEAIVSARGELIAEALRNIETLHHQYTHLPELGPLFGQVQAAVQSFRETTLSKAAG